MKLKIQPTVEWDSITHQEQPTNSTCVHACLAMALGVPVATVVDVVGADAPVIEFAAQDDHSQN